jgi:hypothetical protein
VGPRAGLDAGATRKTLCSCWGSNPDRPACSQTLYCLSSSALQYFKLFSNFFSSLRIATIRCSLRFSGREEQRMGPSMSVCLFVACFSYPYQLGNPQGFPKEQNEPSGLHSEDSFLNPSRGSTPGFAPAVLLFPGALSLWLAKLWESRMLAPRSFVPSPGPCPRWVEKPSTSTILGTQCLPRGS